MKLQTKSVLAFNICLIIACIVMALIGWFSANAGFDTSLQVQAASNLRIMVDNMDALYPGDWDVRDGILYKGDHNMNEDTEIVDRFGSSCHGFVTLLCRRHAHFDECQRPKRLAQYWHEG